MSTLFLDAHASQNFTFFFKNRLVYGSDIAVELAGMVSSLEDIDKIMIITGPGSFTSLRIGSSFAIAYGLARKIEVIGINLFKLLLLEYPDAVIYFYTGTKKWIKKELRKKDKIIEIDSSEFKDDKPWISNRADLLVNLKNNNIQYPNIALLMSKYEAYAGKDLKLIYPVTNFVKK